MKELESRRDIDIITAEIQDLCREAQRTLLLYAVEIGRRLVEAKDVLPHGEWGKWLEEKVNFSQSTANKHMQLFHAYGNKQMSFLGAELNSETFTNLTYSQALKLLAIPDPGEREEFIKNNDIESMSTRELQKAIKERDEALEDAADETVRRVAAEEELAEVQNCMDNLKGEIDNLRRQIEDKESRIKKLSDTIDSTNNITSDLQAKYEKAKQAEKKAKNKLKELKENSDIPSETLDKLKAEAEVAAAERLKADTEKELAEAKNRLEKAETEASRAIAEAEQLRNEIKKRELASNKSIIEFETLFRTAQENMNKLVDVINNADAEIAVKLRTALGKYLEKYMQYTEV